MKSWNNMKRQSKRSFLVFSVILLLALNMVCFLHFVPLAHAQTITTFDTMGDAYDQMIENTTTNYAASQSASTGTPVIDNLEVGQSNITNIYFVDRSFLRFDTSTLPSYYTITAARLALGGYSDTSTVNFNFRLQKWTGATNGVSGNDFDDFDGINYDDGLFSTASFSLTLYNNITITNFALIQLGGYTDICIRSDREIAATPPPNNEYVMLDGTGLPQPPKLVVTYTTTDSAPEYDYVDIPSNVDSSASIGTQTNFTTEKYTDNIYDTLTEASYGGANTTSDVFTDGFEDGTFGKWDGNGATSWTDDGGICTNSSNLEGWASTSHSGTYYAGTGATGDGNLISDNQAMSGVWNIGIAFWYAVDDTDGAGELTFQYGMGATNSTAIDLSGGTEDAWTYYSVNVTSSTYFTSTFYLKFVAACGNNEAVYIDDVVVNKTAQTTLCRLDIEEQFTFANFSRTYTELCVLMSTRNNSENLRLDYWNATASAWITAVATLTMSAWNNVSVATYSTSSAVTFTIRFVDVTQTTDTACDTWSKDACLLHTWDGAVPDITKPTYSSISTNSTVWATVCNFSISINDETALHPNGQYTFGCNNTGPFTNETAINFTTTSQLVSIAKTLNSTNPNATSPMIVQFEWWFTDNVGNQNNTGLQTLTLCWQLSVGWNNVTIFEFDAGYTLSGTNASLNYDSINWAYIVYQNSSTTAQYVFVKNMETNKLIRVYQTTGILLIFCNTAGNWTHTYPYQGGDYGEDPTPYIIGTIVATSITIAAYGLYKRWKKKKKAS